ncbi:MAG: hypothetical protein GY909_12985 [Oligoflexia bacterium]|nr:hypothetical protein [Oligoflexia bacterium]
MLMKKIAILSILLGFSNLAQASTNQTAGQVDNSSAKKAPKAWKVGLGSTFESNLQRTDSTDYSLTNTTYGSLKFTTEGGTSISTSVAIDKDLQGDREQNLRDSTLSLGRSLQKFNDETSLSGSLAFTIPLSDSSRESTGLKTAVRLRPALSYDASKSITEGLSITYLPSVKAYFHDYETKASGGSNTQYAVANRLVIGYSITDSLGLSLDNTYLRTWTYSGVSKDIYSLYQSLGYDVNENFALTVGHAIGGSVLAVNGQEQDIDLFDSENSTIYFDLSFSY